MDPTVFQQIEKHSLVVNFSRTALPVAECNRFFRINALVANLNPVQFSKSHAFKNQTYLYFYQSWLGIDRKIVIENISIRDTSF